MISVMKQPSIFDPNEIFVTVTDRGEILKNCKSPLDQLDNTVALLFKWLIEEQLNKIDKDIKMPTYSAETGFQDAQKAFKNLRTPYLLVELEHFLVTHLESIRAYTWPDNGYLYQNAIQAFNTLKSIKEYLVKLHQLIPA
jgi:hypothetical protein